MRFRWKLLIIFLALTLFPILVMRTFGTGAVRKLGDELILRMSENRTTNMKYRLQILLNGYFAAIWNTRKQVEMALFYQAREVERCLKSKAPQPVKTYYAADFNEERSLPSDTRFSTHHFRILSDGSMDFLKISMSHQVFKLPPGSAKKVFAADIARLTSMTPVYRQIYQNLQGIASWQLTTLSNGLHSAYPGHNGIPWRLNPLMQPWYSAADTKKRIWSEPYVDPETRQIVTAASLPVRDAAGRLRGITAIVIPIHKLLGRGPFAPEISLETEAFLCLLTANPSTGAKGVQIYVREEYTDLKPRSWRFQIKHEWLESNDRGQFHKMITDLDSGKGNTLRMPYKGRDCLWVYGPAEGGLFLVLITPYSDILAGLEPPKKYIQGLIDRLLLYTLYGIAALIVLVVIAAFLFSRTITRPIQALVDSAGRLAEGRFDTQVKIFSRDEFGDMGKVFNTVGPRLKEHYQMRQSLALAREVQQNLIPRTNPLVNGLDIAGKCIYCDDTGGDYYDFLNIKKARGRIRIVVGDVSDHGIPSALLMTTARALLRQRSALSGSIRQIVSDVNLELTRDIEASGRFMTLFFCKLNANSRSISWVRAGHDPAILYDPATDTFDELFGQGLPLGVFENTVYQELKRDLALGQIIVIGTDGIWETISPSGERFGKKRMQQVIRTHARQPAEKILRSIIESVTKFRSPLEQKDDITLVVIKINPFQRSA